VKSNWKQKAKHTKNGIYFQHFAAEAKIKAPSSQTVLASQAAWGKEQIRTEGTSNLRL